VDAGLMKSILQVIRDGYRNKQIADTLSIAED
jgi:DNA-binding NarL/FixJ family response regulator